MVWIYSKTSFSLFRYSEFLGFILESEMELRNCARYISMVLQVVGQLVPKIGKLKFSPYFFTLIYPYLYLSIFSPFHFSLSYIFLITPHIPCVISFPSLLSYIFLSSLLHFIDSFTISPIAPPPSHQFFSFSLALPYPTHHFYMPLSFPVTAHWRFIT